MKTFLLLLMAAAAVAALAQEQPALTTTVPTEPPPPPEKSLSLFFDIPILDFKLSDKNSDDSVAFKPNGQMNWGLEGNYDGFTAGFSLPIPASADSVATKGHTDHFDLLAGHYWDRIGGDVFYQHYRGFYVDQESDGDSNDNQTYQKRSDISTTFYGANFYYSFTPDKFPLQNLNDFKVEGTSKGHGIVAVLGVNDFVMSGSQPLLAKAPLTGATLTSLTMGAGYGIRWSKRNHVVNGLALIGFGPQWQTLRDSEFVEHAIKFSEQLTLNGSYGYHFGDWMGGFIAKMNTVKADVGNNQNLETESFDVKVFLSRTL